MTDRLKIIVAVALWGTLGFLILTRKGQEIRAQISSEVVEIMENLKRGERLNNPGNIEKSSIVWKGQATEQPDSRFVAFISPEYGIRALGKILLTYYNKHGLNTVAGIINRYAPPIENPTASYTSFVANSVGVLANQPIDVNNSMILQKLVSAIIRYEQGRVIYEPVQVAGGVNMALGIA